MTVILVTAITLLLLGLFFGLSPFLALGFFLLAVHLLNRFWLERVLHRLNLTRHHESHAFLGDIVKVRLQVENQSNLPIPWLLLEERLPTQLAAEGRKTWVLSMSSHEKRELDYNLRAIKRGRYKLGPLDGSAGTIYPESSDLAGDNLNWNLSSFLTVYPLIVPLERLGLPSRLPQGNIKASRSLLPDATRFAGVRDYAAGDDPRHINWASSARLGRLQVKEYDRTQMLPLAIFLELGRASYDRSSSWLASECAISVAASLANYAVRLGQSVGLYTNGRDPYLDNPEGLNEVEMVTKKFQRADQWYAAPVKPVGAANQEKEPEVHTDIKLAPHTGNGQLTAILETLARTQLWEANALLYNLMNRWSSELSWGATVAVVAPKPSPELVNSMLRLRKGGFAVFSVFTEEAYGPAQLSGYSATVRALGFTSFDATNPEELNAGAERHTLAGR